MAERVRVVALTYNLHNQVGAEWLVEALLQNVPETADVLCVALQEAVPNPSAGLSWWLNTWMALDRRKRCLGNTLARVGALVDWLLAWYSRVVLLGMRQWFPPALFAPWEWERDCKTNVARHWAALLGQQLAQQNRPMALVASETFGMGLVSLVFCAEGGTGVDAKGAPCSIATGFFLGSCLANKGAIRVPLTVRVPEDASKQQQAASLCCSFIFLNAHLPAHQKTSGLRRRNRAIRQILLSEHWDPRGRETILLTGDLNYRLRCDQRVFRALIEDSDAHADRLNLVQRLLLQQDELREQLQKHPDFRGFQEAPLDFLPTYKLKSRSKGSSPSTFDGSGNSKSIWDEYAWKRRVPAFCDRVLVRPGTGQQVEFGAYRSLNNVLHYSDHYPVSCELTLEPLRSESDRQSRSKSNQQLEQPQIRHGLMRSLGELCVQLAPIVYLLLLWTCVALLGSQVFLWTWIL